MTILDFHNVSFSYEPAEGHSPCANLALQNLSFQLQPGEFLAVVGGNGSGKSTMAKMINALLLPDSGSVTVNAMDTSDLTKTYDIRTTAAMVFQNPDDQIVATLVEDEVAFGPENLRLPSEEIRRRVTKSLEAVGLVGFEKRETHSLSGGQKQKLAIAGALAMEPKILVLDEPTAMLDPAGRHSLLELLEDLNSGGLTVVLITHYMEEAARASRVLGLQNGRVAFDGAPEEVLTNLEALKSAGLEAPFAAQMSGVLSTVGLDIQPTLDIKTLAAEIEGVLGPHPLAQAEFYPSAPERSLPEEPLLSLESVKFSYGDNVALKNLSLSIMEGECLGIAGATGSGKSTLLQLCAGLLHPLQGEVQFRAQSIAKKAALNELRRNLGFAFQYPERQLFAPTVFEDIAFGPRNLGLESEEVETRVRESLETVGLDLDLLERSPFALSGGQQRRVAIAGILAMAPSILIMDEPAAGLDPKNRDGLLNLLKSLNTAEGITVVIVSHSMDDLGKLCDRLVILEQGEIAAEGSTASVFSKANLLSQAKLALPSVVELSSMLGYEKPFGKLPTIDSLASALAG